MVIQKPRKVFSLPSPWIVALPALSDRCLDGLRLAQVALARGMRPGQDARQKQIHIEYRAHARPPM